MNNQYSDQIKIYVITTGNPDRISRINHFLNGLDYELVYSLPKDELAQLESEYESYSHQFRQKSMMAGEIGAFNTHSIAWNKIQTSNVSGIIIEDNIEFIQEPLKLLDKDVIETIKKCGLVTFTDFRFNLDPFSPFKISDVVEKKPFPIVCYGIDPHRAGSLLGRMKKSAYSLPVDKWLSIPKLCGCYAFVSPIKIGKRAGKSNVPSIANKKKGKKTFSPKNMSLRIYNKIKYSY